MQRAITDFGADDSFSKAIEKIKEHYGIEVSSWAVRETTKKHAEKMQSFKGLASEGEEIIVMEADGSLIPIVEVATQEGGDLRKKRKTCWKEVKLSCARGKDKIKRFYAGIIGSAEEAGQKMLESALLAGMKEGSHVHALGDGASWIVEQFKLKFCNRGNYTIDFFHLCEYLSKAAIWCSVFEADKWLEESKEKLKSGNEKQVFEEIKKKFESLESPDRESGILECYRYMEKRLDYMNYKAALDKDLPIGSGEIESSHRSVVQKRLKIAGAWWKKDTANAILALRINRFNGYWENYWHLQRLAA